MPYSITRNNTSLFKYSALTLCLSALLQPVQAQEDTKSNKTADKLFEKIEVTARKRIESIQDVPVAITAFGEDQLDAMKFRNMNDLSVGIANVVLEDVGTWCGQLLNTRPRYQQLHYANRPNRRRIC